MSGQATTTRALPALAASFAALLACAAPAGARDVAHVHGMAEVHAYDGTAADLTGLPLVLAGGRVVTGVYGDRAVPRILLMRHDGSLRALTAFDPPVDVPAITFERAGPNRTDVGGSDEALAASGSLLLVANSWGTQKTSGSGYRVGDVDGDDARFHRCRGVGGSWPPAIAVSGRAFAHDVCGPPGGGVVVRDLARPNASPRRFEPPGDYRVDHVTPSGVRMAGRYLALASSFGRRGMLQVFDWRTGREIYRVPPTALDSAFSFALQSDGKVVVNQPDHGQPDTSVCEGHAPLRWYSRREPRPHVLPFRPCAEDVAMARGRIVYRGPGEEGTALWMTDTSGRPPLRLSGPPWVTDGIDFLEPFDFDGRRVAYGEPACVDERVVRDTVAAIERHGYLRAVSCTARFAGRRPVEEWEDGTIAVRVRCPSGCEGNWAIRTAEPHGRLLLDGGGLHVPRGTTQIQRSVESALPRRRAGRKPRRVRVRVVLYVVQPGGTYRRFTHTTTIRTTRSPRGSG
jgi:hypothetical protein